MPAWVTEDAEPEPASLEPAAQPEGRLEAQVSCLVLHVCPARLCSFKWHDLMLSLSAGWLLLLGWDLRCVCLHRSGALRRSG